MIVEAPALSAVRRNPLKPKYEWKEPALIALIISDATSLGSNTPDPSAINRVTEGFIRVNPMISLSKN